MTWRDQRGMGLVEVMFSAALVIVVAGAVLSTIDKAQETTGALAAQSVSSNIAQQDQDRLRALRVGDLANLSQVRSVDVKGVEYEIESSGTFISEATQEAGCTNTDEANFIRIRSSVRSPAMDEPIQLTSIVNPAVGTLDADSGSMVVKLLGAAGGGTQGIDVVIDGPSDYTQTTDADGCAFFAYAPEGVYTVSYSEPGYVSRDAVQDVTFQGSVTNNQTISYQFEYDRAGSIEALPHTIVDGVVRADVADVMALLHPNLPGGSGRKDIAPNPAPGASVPAAPLYPFTSAYSFHSGNCNGNVLPPALTSGLPAGFASAQLVEPGNAYSVRLFEPALVPTVRVDGNVVQGARVVFTETTTDCSGRSEQMTDATGQVPDPGLPHGEWTVCAEVRVNGVMSSVTTTGLRNDQAGGRRLDLVIPYQPPTGVPCV